MHKRISISLILVLFAFVMIGRIQNSVDAQTCTQGVCATDDDTDGPDVLEEKLKSDLETITIDASNDTYLDFAFNPAKVAGATWGEDDSSFTWTFDAGATYDPSYRFANAAAYLQNARVSVNTEPGVGTNSACSLFVGDYLNSTYGVVQTKDSSLNIFAGNTLIGEGSPDNGIALLVNRTFSTDASNCGLEKRDRYIY